MKIAVILFAAAFVAVASAFPQQAPRTTPVPILSREDTHNNDGTYEIKYTTGDGVLVTEVGRKGVNAKGESYIIREGSYAYHAPDGTPVAVGYIADEHGFRVSGSHLPVAPTPIAPVA